MQYHFGYLTIHHITPRQEPGGTVMIYERIKKLREKQGYTQTELAKMLGVTRSCVNAWEILLDPIHSENRFSHLSATFPFPYQTRNAQNKSLRARSFILYF